MIRLDLRPGDGVRVDLPYTGEVILVDCDPRKVGVGI